MKRALLDALGRARGTEAPEKHPLHLHYVQDLKILFLMSISQFFLIGAYKYLYGSWIFRTDFLQAPPWSSFIPYLGRVQEPVSSTASAAVGVYYLIAVAIFGGCVTRFWIRRTGTLRVKNLLLMIAVLVVFGWFWAYGIDIRRTRMSGFHRGEVFGHVKYMVPMVLLVSISCIAVFRKAPQASGSLSQ